MHLASGYVRTGDPDVVAEDGAPDGGDDARHGDGERHVALVLRRPLLLHAQRGRALARPAASALPALLRSRSYSYGDGVTLPSSLVKSSGCNQRELAEDPRFITQSTNLNSHLVSSDFCCLLALVVRLAML